MAEKTQIPSESNTLTNLTTEKENPNHPTFVTFFNGFQNYSQVFHFPLIMYISNKVKKKVTVWEWKFTFIT